jgi:hypothetical protein
MPVVEALQCLVLQAGEDVAHQALETGTLILVPLDEDGKSIPRASLPLFGRPLRLPTHQQIRDGQPMGPSRSVLDDDFPGKEFQPLHSAHLRHSLIMAIQAEAHFVHEDSGIPGSANRARFRS